MSDTPSTFEIVGSGILGLAYFAYAWHKRKTQFGSRLHHVRVYAAERELRCHVCDGNMFYKREGLINTTWATLFKLDPLNESAHCVVCETCGYAHWFATRPGVGPAAYLRYEFGSDSDPIRGPR
jgi:hypothetical protein